MCFMEDKNFDIEDILNENSTHQDTSSREFSLEDILNEYYDIRLELYQKRKENKLVSLAAQLKIISNKVKFILMIVEKKLDINNKKKSEIEETLEKLKFHKNDNNYKFSLFSIVHQIVQ